MPRDKCRCRVTDWLLLKLLYHSHGLLQLVLLASFVVEKIIRKSSGTREGPTGGGLGKAEHWDYIYLQQYVEWHEF